MRWSSFLLPPRPAVTEMTLMGAMLRNREEESHTDHYLRHQRAKWAGSTAPGVTSVLTGRQG